VVYFPVFIFLPGIFLSLQQVRRISQFEKFLLCVCFLGTRIAFGGAFRALIRQIGWLFAGTKLNKWQN
jgi:hypothetical protein